MAVEALHQAAQARLGVAAAYLSLAEWGAVSATQAAETSAVWLTRSVRIIAAIRRKSRQLAIAYYQLTRALETGRTFGVPEGSSANNVTLGKLRKNFEDLTKDIADIGNGKGTDPDPDIAWFEQNLRDHGSVERGSSGRSIRLEDTDLTHRIKALDRVKGHDNDAHIDVDAFTWPREWELQKVDDAFRALLRKQAVDKSAEEAKKLRANEELSHDQAIAKIEKAHADAGSVGSGITDWAGIQHGRDVIDLASRRDRMVKAVARGTSASPCAFCAMLASRGFVYKSEATAGFGDTVEQFHVNCHCYPIVRWTKETELPALNRYFQEKWPEVTRGYSGVDALNAWRRWLYAERKNLPAAPAALAA